MCGIAGVVRWEGRPPTAGEVHAMCDQIVHRGPDDEGRYVDEFAGIGMRRLSIIDVAGGHQPVHNEDRSVWVVFNGEIYNFRELRRDLEARGHVFYTSTDTEAIVHLYEEYGADAVHHLRGMFAYAIWDVRKRRLLVARDRLGIKPLYYSTWPGGFAFASELKALLTLPEIRRDLSWPAVAHFLAFHVTPATQSIVGAVQKLEPAHRAVVTPGRPPSIDRYWDVRFVGGDPDGAEPPESGAAAEDALVEELRSLLDEAVQLHLRSDVPLGAFLSGGIDSSAVVAAMAPHAAGRVNTFSVGFRDHDFDELAHARPMAALCGATHHEIVVEPQAPESLAELVWHLDEPFGDSSAIPTYAVSRLAARHVKVVLTGDGGDELFGGYDKYVVEARERQFERVPRSLRRLAGLFGGAMPEGATGRRFLMHLALDGPQRYLDASLVFTRRDQARLLTPAAFEQVSRTDPLASAAALLGHDGASWLSALQYWDLREYLPQDILVKVDRMTMAHSLEARPVLLDHRIVEFAARVPASMRLRGRTTKYLFKRALRGRVPDAIIDRPKHGFGVPLGRWFRNDWTGFARDILLSDRSRQRGVIDPRYVTQLLRLHDQGRDMDRQIWTLLCFEQWCRLFIDGSPSWQPASASSTISTANLSETAPCPAH